MKKLILITSIVTSLATSSALAKTEGHQVGIDLLRSTAKHRYQNDGVVASNYKKFDDAGYGVGANYKYAFNFNNYFVAPEIFAEYLNTKAKDQDNDTISIDYRYGAKLNLGYDFTDKFATYLSFGFGRVSYQVDWKSISRKKSSKEGGALYGVGVAYNISENVVAGLEYGIQKLTLDTPNAGGINQAETDIRTLKLGLAYRF